MTKEIEKKEDDMILMKGILREVVKSGEYDGYNAKRYYDRLTKVSWKDESLELYEESLDRNEFVAHNTILTIFTDIEKDKEDQITKPVKTKGDNDMSTKTVKAYDLMTKKELQKEIEGKGLTYKVRDTKEILLSILDTKTKEDRKTVKIPVKKLKKTFLLSILDKKEDKPKTGLSEEEKAKSMKTIGIKKKMETEELPEKEDEVEVEDLVNQLCEVATLRELIQAVRVLGKKVEESGKGVTLIKKLYKVMESDFSIWIIENKALIEEQNRKYEKIKKLKTVGKKSESKADHTSEGKEKKKTIVSKGEEAAILESLKGKKLTEKILSGIGWRTLKKLAKDRGVKSFGKSKSYIVKRLLRNKKK